VSIETLTALLLIQAIGALRVLGLARSTECYAGVYVYGKTLQERYVDDNPPWS